jgi:hypothetical protein
MKGRAGHLNCDQKLADSIAATFRLFVWRKLLCFASAITLRSESRKFKDDILKRLKLIFLRAFFVKTKRVIDELGGIIMPSKLTKNVSN